MTSRNGASTVAKTPPVHQIRLGRMRAAIWENTTENGTFQNVTFSRLYKDEFDQWQDSASFGRDDLPLLAKVVDEVHTWLYRQPQNDSQTAAARQTNADEAPF